MPLQAASVDTVFLQSGLIDIIISQSCMFARLVVSVKVKALVFLKRHSDSRICDFCNRRVELNDTLVLSLLWQRCRSYFTAITESSCHECGNYKKYCKHLLHLLSSKEETFGFYRSKLISSILSNVEKFTEFNGRTVFQIPAKMTELCQRNRSYKPFHRQR